MSFLIETFKKRSVLATENAENHSTAAPPGTATRTVRTGSWLLCPREPRVDGRSWVWSCPKPRELGRRGSPGPGQTVSQQLPGTGNPDFTKIANNNDHYHRHTEGR